MPSFMVLLCLFEVHRLLEGDLLLCIRIRVHFSQSHYFKLCRNQREHRGLSSFPCNFIKYVPKLKGLILIADSAISYLHLGNIIPSYILHQLHQAADFLLDYFFLFCGGSSLAGSRGLHHLHQAANFLLDNFFSTLDVF